jgi:hypothetical protein
MLDTTPVVFLLKSSLLLQYYYEINSFFCGVHIFFIIPTAIFALFQELNVHTFSVQLSIYYSCISTCSPYFELNR